MIHPSCRHWLLAGLAALAINGLLLWLLQQLSAPAADGGHRGGHPAPVSIQTSPDRPAAQLAAAPPSSPAAPAPPAAVPPPPAMSFTAAVPVAIAPAATGLPTDPAGRLQLSFALPEAGSGAPAAPTDGYHLAEVDQPPTALHQPPPLYPLAARRQQLSGEVLVRLRIDASGRVDRVRILRAQPPGLFEQSVEQAVRSWRFRPGQLGGTAVPVWLELPVRFELAP